MNSQRVKDYYQQKKELLAQCLQFSEELISSIENWDDVPRVMAEKEAAILRLKDLEESTDDSVKASLSPEQRQELNQAIRLILDLDGDTVQQIRSEQEEIKDSLKATINSQKIMQYAQTPQLPKGTKLDYKK